jgi:predicted acylesterase/phospholipase RssA
VLFDNASVTVEVLVASACLPFVFPAVRIGERAYWDGGYAGNPPLGPLLAPTPPEELVLIRAQPGRRPGVPTTPMEIMNRLNEIACHNVLTAELAALPASVHLTSYDADAALLDLPISSKFNGEAEFLSELFEAGRSAVATHRPASHPAPDTATHPPASHPTQGPAAHRTAPDPAQSPAAHRTPRLRPAGPASRRAAAD